MNLSFLGWSRPLPELAVEKLAEGWNPSAGPLDLNDLLIIVPTAASARRLRRGLARHAATCGGGVLSPHIVPPQVLLQAPASKSFSAAGEATRLAVWIRVLREAGLDDYRSLFPVAAHPGDIRWAIAVAERFVQLQDQLAEQSLSIGDIAARELPGEPERWMEMATLEEAYFKVLAELGLEDPNMSKASAPLEDSLPPGIRRIILIGVPDPVPLLLRKIESAAGAFAVEVWVNAPDDFSPDFDDWGRPLPGSWEMRTIPLAESSLVLAGGPGEQAETLCRLVAGCGPRLNASDIALAALDEGLFPYIEAALAKRGVRAFNPVAGSPVLSSPGRFLQNFATLAETSSYEALSTLFRQPDFLAVLCAESGGEFDDELFLKELDEFYCKRMPSSLRSFGEALAREEASRLKRAGAAREKELPGDDETVFSGLVPTDRLRLAFTNVQRLLEDFKNSRSLDFVKAMLAELCAVRPDVEPGPAQEFFIASADLIKSSIDEFSRPCMEGLSLRPGEELRILLHILKGESIHLARPDDALGIEGWLELPFETAPQLLICGMNEGYVPKSISEDLFLPDSARETLGLACGRRRFARDAFLLRTLIEARRDKGGLHCIVGKSDPEGDPLKPSRLLFLCPREELPGRARLLFGPLSDTRKPRHSAPSGDWLLKAPTFSAITELSATAFKSYLACPFRFYLQHLLGMEHVDDLKRELDPRDFGTFCHRVLEDFGRNIELRDSIDQNEISRFFENTLYRVLSARYGDELPLPLMVQAEILRQRLKMAAGRQAQLNREGWRISEVEIPVSGKIGPLAVRAKIDRIDRHEDGRIRIVDYKTGEAAVNPRSAHIRSVRSAAYPDYCLFNDGRSRWEDLQLPLYLMLLQQKGILEKDLSKTECCYFNIPKSLPDTGINEPWLLTENELEQARKTSEKIACRINTGMFWPPSDAGNNDAFAELGDLALAFAGAPKIRAEAGQ